MLHFIDLIEGNEGKRGAEIRSNLEVGTLDFVLSLTLPPPVMHFIDVSGGNEGLKRGG